MSFTRSSSHVCSLLVATRQRKRSFLFSYTPKTVWVFPTSIASSMAPLPSFSCPPSPRSAMGPIFPRISIAAGRKTAGKHTGSARIRPPSARIGRFGRGSNADAPARGGARARRGRARGAMRTLAQGGAGRTWRSSGRTPVRSLTDNATSPKCPAGRSARVTAGRHGANPGAGPDSDSATGRISLRPQASGSERFAPGR